MKAMLIIDMQVGGFPDGVYRHDATAVIGRINRIADRLRNKGGKVIFVQHDGTREGSFIPGTQEWALLPQLNRGVNDMIISKTANDAFYKSSLNQLLNELGVGELIVTGWATDFCVDTTVRSALNNDFFVTVVSDAHTVGDREYLPADKVVEHHNKVWAGMIPTKGSVRVVPSADLLLELA